MVWALLIISFFAPAGFALLISRIFPSRFDRHIADRQAKACVPGPKIDIHVVEVGGQVGTFGSQPIFTHYLAHIRRGTFLASNVRLHYDGMVDSKSDKSVAMYSEETRECIFIDGRIAYRSAPLSDLRCEIIDAA